jgi:hypothetical protein
MSEKWISGLKPGDIVTLQGHGPAQAEGWKEMCRVLADAHNMLDQRDALIRELVAALVSISAGFDGEGRVFVQVDRPTYTKVSAALKHAKAAGYDP